MVEQFKKGPMTINSEPSKTQQHFEPVQNINNIMARYKQTGELGNGKENYGTYADVSNIPDFHTAQNIIAGAQSKFAQLPSKLRDRFSNSPQALLAFLQNKNNKAEAIELGLINPDPIKPDPDTQPATKADLKELKKEAKPTTDQSAT
nr:MAG: internal scaffolding protein [Microviridae sp.]